MNLFEINEICRDNLSVIDYLQRQGILHSNVDCAACQIPCSLVKQSQKLCGYTWRCKRCRRKQSVLKDSFLAHSKIKPSKFLYMVFYWATRAPQYMTKKHLDLGTHANGDWFQYFREVCSTKLLGNAMQLGGPGKEVQVDESLLVRAKYHVGRNARRRQTWVFGAYDMAQKVGFVKFVNRRDAATLLPIIQRVVAPGSVIISDEWRAYRGIPALPGNYLHRTVNHSRHFVDPATGSHTNGVESYWSRIKANFKRMHGTSKEMIPSYLDEHMWRERYGRTDDLAYLNLLSHIAEQYPC